MDIKSVVLKLTGPDDILLHHHGHHPLDIAADPVRAQNHTVVRGAHCSVRLHMLQIHHQ